VHQPSYYRGRDTPPNDYDAPNPVTFLSVPAGVAFIVALSCEDGALRDLAERFVKEALREWGIGGKTSAGYGRMSVCGAKPLKPADGSPVLNEFADWLRSSQKQVTQGEQLACIERDWLVRLQSLPPSERERVKKLLIKQIKSPKKQKQRDDLIRKISGP
jgi:CRISPR-associated protein Cmr6